MLKGSQSLPIDRGIAALALLGMMACAQAPARVAVSEATRAEYQQRCALCHGEQGDGRGPHASSLPVPVANWSNAAWQSRVSDDQITQAIVGGGVAIGKSSAMPPNPDLQGKPMLDEMVSLIRGFER